MHNNCTSVILALAAFTASNLASSAALGDECPIHLLDHTAKSWAKAFEQRSPIIFRGRIVSIHFITLNEKNEPVFSVGYQVLENIKGAISPSFTAEWRPWCDDCNTENAMKGIPEMIGKEYLIQGGLYFRDISWSFSPDGCWGFISLPFRKIGEADEGDLLTSLRSLEHNQSPPQ